MRYSATRYLSTLIAATVLVVSGLVTGSNVALAVRECITGNNANSADLRLTQAPLELTNSSTDPVWTFLKQVTVVNDGPCQVHRATFTDILPEGAANVQFTTTPNSWTLQNLTPNSTGHLVLTLTSTASIGVPGTQLFDITFTLVAADTTSSTDVTDTALITIGGGLTDGDPSNNCSVLGYIGDNGGTVSSGNLKTNTQSCPFASDKSQVEQVTFTPPAVPDPLWFIGNVSIQEDSAPCQPSGFGRCMHFVYNNYPSDFTKVFVINLATITDKGGSYNSVGIFWVEGGISLSSCNGPQPTNPCISDKSKFKIGRATFVRITIEGTDLKDGGYGWQ
jgi:hypothetical protein